MSTPMHDKNCKNFVVWGVNCCKINVKKGWLRRYDEK